MKNKADLIDVVDKADLASDTLRIARGLVANRIAAGQCDCDRLVAIDCVLERAASQFRQSIAIADKLRKAQGIKAA